MNFIKQNINKILLVIIYIVVFFGLSELIHNLLYNYVTENNQEILGTVIINVALYLIMLVSGIILLKSELVYDIKKLNNTNAMKVFYICLAGIGAAYLGNYIGSIMSMTFGGAGNSANQDGVETMIFSPYGVIMVIVTVIIGPIVEELVFRKSIHGICRNLKCPTWLMIIISSLLFGLIHVINAGDFVYVFPYIFMGVALGGIEIISKNIYPAIIVHMFINAMSVSMLMFLKPLEEIMPMM